MKDSTPANGVESDNWFTNSGFDLVELFKLSIRFFKDNESKAFHPSYNDRNYFLSLVLQAKHGPFIQDKAKPLGTLDIVGRDRRRAWVELGSMDRDTAMSTFINYLDNSCNSFKPYIEAHKREKEERENLKKKQEELRLEKQKEEEQRRIEEQNKKNADEESRQLEEQRRAIKENLSSQTYTEFKLYAERQYPNNIEQQNILIGQLQELHFQQYMEQVLQYQMINQMNSKQKTNTFSNPESPLLNKQDSRIFYESTINPSEDLNNIRKNDSIKPKDNENKSEGTNIKNEVDNVNKNEKENVNENENENEIETENENENEKDEDEESDVEFDEENEVGLITNAQMWTNKDIKSFKESIRKENGDGIINVAHGEIVTVRVPTHPDGTCIFWEFATDSYDIGFGLLFEWTKNPGNQVSVHISESEEEDDDDDDDEIVVHSLGNSRSQDPERGDINKPKNSDELPISVVIPIFRRDCHDEVYVGRHVYPGKGLYLLKFDNSYSVWRSKTLYYKVYYTK